MEETDSIFENKKSSLPLAEITTKNSFMRNNFVNDLKRLSVGSPIYEKVLQKNLISM